MQLLTKSKNFIKKNKHAKIYSLSVVGLLMAVFISKAIGQAKTPDLVDQQDEYALVSHISGSTLQTGDSKAYVIVIDGQDQVAVANKEQAVQLLEGAKSFYDENQDYLISLQWVEEEQAYVAGFAKQAASMETDTAVEMDFSQNIYIEERDIEEEDILPYEEAQEVINRGGISAESYRVLQGDSVYSIANLYGISVEAIMEANQGIDQNYTIKAGEELIIPSEVPVISVISKEKILIEEEYFAEPVIEYNEQWYSSQVEVKQEAQAGVLEVTKEVTYENGVEVAEEVVNENTQKEAVPQIIVQGTMELSQYGAPLLDMQVSSLFGERWGKMHKGLDFACDEGTPVMSALAGTAEVAGWVNGYGYCIYLNHEDGTQTRYAHLSQVQIEAGQTVEKGQQIGLSGNTGNSTGPHLHFEILEEGIQVDPYPYIIE